MTALVAVWRRELAAFFDTPVAWVTCALFVLTLHGLYFFLGYPVGDLALPGFWEGRVASLQVVFSWLPALFVVLVPALTMGAWAEERRAGTDELLLTLPITPVQAVLGKFLAAWCQLVVLLGVAILPLAAVVAGLGPLDWSTAVGGLVGAALLGASFVALGLWISALSGEQLIAFLLAAVLLGALWTTSLLVRVVPAGAATFLHAASPATHDLETAALGVLDLRDLVYHGSLTALGLALNTLAVRARLRGSVR